MPRKALGDTPGAFQNIVIRGMQRRYALVIQGHDVDNVADPLGEAVSIFITLPE